MWNAIGIIPMLPIFNGLLATDQHLPASICRESGLIQTAIKSHSCVLSGLDWTTLHGDKKYALLISQKITPKNFAFAETKRKIPSGQDRPILPARVANQNTGLTTLYKMSRGIPQPTH